MNERDINAMWQLVANHTAAELAKMLISERARRRSDAAAVWDWLLARTGQHRPGQSRGIRELRAEWERE